MPCIGFLFCFRVLIIFLNHRHHRFGEPGILLTFVVVRTSDGKLVQEYFPQFFFR